jgi:hypothetical protein
MKENRLIMIDDATLSQARINYIESDLIDKANNAEDRQEIEQLKEHAIRCGLGELSEQIEAVWAAKRAEHIRWHQAALLNMYQFSIMLSIF